MINLENYNRIVAFGCSWTAGDELNDHKILNLNYEKCKELKIKNGLSGFYNLRNDDNITYQELIKDQKHKNLNSSWAAKLAKNLDLDFLNLAKGGTGIDEHFLEMFKFFQKDFRKGDLILLGLTQYTRILKWPSNDTYTTALTNLNYLGKVPKEVVKWNLEYLWSYNNFIVNYLKTVENILNLNDNVYVQFMRPICDPQNDFDDNNIHYIVKDLYYYIKQKHKDKFLYNGYIEMQQNDHCGFGHPPEERHTEFANRITKEIVR